MRGYGWSLVRNSLVANNNLSAYPRQVDVGVVDIL